MHILGQEPRKAVGERRTGSHRQAEAHPPQVPLNARPSPDAASEKHLKVGRHRDPDHEREDVQSNSDGAAQRCRALEKRRHTSRQLEAQQRERRKQD